MKTKYVVVELQKQEKGKGGLVQIWACIVGDEQNVFNGSFIESDAEGFPDALETLIRWASSEGDVTLYPEFVVWQKDDLVVHQQLGSGCEIITRDWIDFLSYYAGIRGLSLSEVRNELCNAEFGTVGIDRAQRLARLFALLLRMAKTHRVIVSAAAQASGAHKSIMRESALLQNLFPDE